MNKQEFTKAMTFLGTAYGKEIDSSQVAVWYEMFSENNLEEFKTAIKNLIKTKQFMPSIADIKQEIARMTTPALQLNVDEEWEKVRNALRSYGSYNEEKAMNSLNDYTRGIVRMIGYQRLCQSENIEWERRTFKELFTDRQDYTQELSLKQTPMIETRGYEMLGYEGDEEC